MASLERYTSTGRRNGRYFVTNPWFKFYPTDWQADERVRMCGAAARGLWIEMLCIMHKAEKYGHLLINGEMPTNMQLSILTGISIVQLESLIIELEKMGVFSRTQAGVIYSRRQVNDEKKAKHAKKIGKFGGNPSLSKTKGISSQDNPKDNLGVKAGDKPQKPEARIIFDGKVVRLKQKTFDELLDLSGMAEDDFVDFLDNEDEYYAKISKAEQAKWFFYLKAKIQKMKVA